MYDIRDNNSYTVRKLADGHCWMTDNLQLALEDGVPVVASKNDGSTFSYTPTACATNGACALNGNTVNDSTYGWYYDWYAAIAEVASSFTSDTDYDGSICPKGWRMPSYVSGDTYSWEHFATSYGVTGSGVSTNVNFFVQPISMIKPGYYLNGSTGYSGDRFYGWASTYKNSGIANSILASDHYIYYTNWWDYIYVGFSIRCVAV